MYIHEAVKKAVEKDMCITSKEENGEITFKIKPENIFVGGFCKVSAIPSSDVLTYELWIPSYSDLVNDKWVLVDNDLEILKEKLNTNWWSREKKARW